MGEAKNKAKRLHDLDAGTHLTIGSMDDSIERFEQLVEAGLVDGILQIGKIKTAQPGVFSIQMFNLGLEKPEIYDMLCRMKKGMEETMGFREIDDA